MKLFLGYHNAKVGGPAVVVKNLIKGLSRTDIEIVSDPTEADIVGCLQHPGNDYNKFPRATVMGPNIFVLPDESPEIWNNYKNFVMPSDWVKDIYQNYDINNERNLNVWAVGVDTEEWKPRLPTILPGEHLDCFIYYKNRPKEELVKVVKLLKTHGFTFKIIQYGDYQESQLQTLCNISKFAVVLDDTESQGLAIQQIMSKNIPCLIFNKTSWEYKNNKYDATTVPYFNENCGKITSLDIEEREIHKDINLFYSLLPIFKPRQFIIENFGLELKAREYISILEKSFGKK